MILSHRRHSHIDGRASSIPRLALGLACAATLLLAATAASAQNTGETDDEKAFYSIGAGLAKQFESLTPISDREFEMITKGLRARSIIEGLSLAGQQGRLDSMTLRGGRGEVTRTRYMRVVTDRVFAEDELARLFPSEGSPQPLDDTQRPIPTPGS